MGAGVALKFQGSKFYVGDGFIADSPTVNVTGISKTAPAVVQAAGHNLANGDAVYISGVVGMTEVNDQYFIVESVVAGVSFALADSDATGYGTYVSGGIVQEPNFGSWCELTGYNVQGGTSAEIDTTTICSTAVENVLGLPDRGNMTLDFNYAPKTNIQQVLQASQRSGEVVPFKLELPNAAQNGYVYMFGRVSQASFSGAVGGKHTGSMTIRLTGDIYVQ